MALDIHIGVDERDAEKQFPSLSLNEKTHAMFFSDKNSWMLQYPLFSRIREYYTDVRYAEDEINDLLTEIQQIKNKTTLNKDANIFLESFLELCVLALKNKSSLFCFCD